MVPVVLAYRFFYNVTYISLISMYYLITPEYCSKCIRATRFFGVRIHENANEIFCTLIIYQLSIGFDLFKLYQRLIFVF